MFRKIVSTHPAYALVAFVHRVDEVLVVVVFHSEVVAPSTLRASTRVHHRIHTVGFGTMAALTNYIAVL